MQIITLRPMAKSDIRALASGVAGPLDIAERAAMGLAAHGGLSESRIKNMNTSDEPANGATAYRSPLNEIAFVDAALDDPEQGLLLVGSHADVYYLSIPEGATDALAILEKQGKPDAVHIIAASDDAQSKKRDTGSKTISDDASLGDGKAAPTALFISAVHSALVKFGQVSVARRKLTSQRAAS